MFLLISSYITDLVLGDPEWFPHPTRGVGKLINLLDKRLRGKNTKWKERIKGVIVTFVVVLISICFSYLFLDLSRRLSPYLGALAWIYLGYVTLSIKDLRVKAKAILNELENGSTVEARKQLSKIVSRDTKNLSKNRIITASVESIAENTNDGIIAPLFYLILGGPVIAIAYKSINTLDSMVGYRDEKYIHFGWFSARMDDIVNFIPARISGFLISLSSLIRGDGFKTSFITMLRDGRKHSSPNSGISEAAMAGALRIRLGGASFYKGKEIIKPYIGEERKTLEPYFIDKALELSFIASFLMLCLGVFLRWEI